MATFYGIKTIKINSAFIHSVTTTGGTILFQGDINNSYEIHFRHDLFGCGGPESGILILLRDIIPWTRISFEWLSNGTASCWSFMNTVTNYGTATGTPTGNLLEYDESLGDGIVRSYLTWEIPQFQSQTRTSACDNNTNNFFIFNGGIYRSFQMTRRRNTSIQSLAGIHHGRSCNSTGAVTIIRNIRIW